MTTGRVPRRLGRILALIPYVIQNPGVTLDELGERFGVTRRELKDDLELIFLCGLPGYTPADLIEVDLEGDHVYVRTGDYFDAPLNLTPVEGLALYAGGSTLLALPELDQADALRRALGKLARALGIEGGAHGGGIKVDLDAGPSGHLETLQHAIAERRRVTLEYHSAARGELTRRDVDPWGLIAALGHWYLVGFDHRTAEERMFRIDRMKEVSATDRHADVPEDFDPERYRGAFIGRTGEMEVGFEVSPSVARWFEDYYPVLSSRDARGGWRAVRLLAGGSRWAATLVLRLGRDVRGVEPVEVVEEARRLARSLAERHA